MVRRPKSRSRRGQQKLKFGEMAAARAVPERSMTGVLMKLERD